MKMNVKFWCYMLEVQIELPQFHFAITLHLLIKVWVVSYEIIITTRSYFI